VITIALTSGSLFSSRDASPHSTAMRC
jgi:hypothetical protein